ncbi:DRMBL-domain-containing protein [Zopfia rhizophila CBS 207.26]|uniref:DRMBL-domain-containing protein n=1 Tax=Zopfia rhizophila CBS 207.26 TaxID=1314779 RepID=A0A6A6D6A4_9PEZI|nr:DRMBL-domain-containing protein [Zopfia rhizophila CBS 207.26]
MAAKSVPSTATPKATPTTSKPRQTQTTLVPQNWGTKSPATNGAGRAKPKATANGNIMTFFKKAEEQNNKLFLEERGPKTTSILNDEDVNQVGWEDEYDGVVMEDNDGEARFNESGGSVKKRKISEDIVTEACTPPPPDNCEIAGQKDVASNAAGQGTKTIKRTGPFVDDSESEVEEIETSNKRKPLVFLRKTFGESTMSNPEETSIEQDSAGNSSASMGLNPPLLKAESTSHIVADDFDGFNGLDDDDFTEGEEYDERRWMAEQRRLEIAETGFEGDFDDFDGPPMFPDDEMGDTYIEEEATSSCPICNFSLSCLTDEEASIHVNSCLDGKPQPAPKSELPDKKSTSASGNNSRMFKPPHRPPKAGQQNPFQLRESKTKSNSAFSKLMANYAEDAAWATAAASESAARGKPSYQRTCPFYKILPGFYICVDAFRYGAVKGQNAYFLSHFHSDHYAGLTASWSHGPIYCSKVTANLVRQQLRVDPKWVMDLEFEKKTEVPGTEGVHVTMIPANHCPGSSLFLFEKEIGRGKNPRLQRVLHCGDFRACQAHVEHPLLRPEVLDAAGGKNRQQKLDVCYLDTTYLNPKYAFPPQEQVIQACADMCISLNKVRADETDGWEQMKRERTGEGMVKFVRKNSEAQQEESGGEGDIDAMKIAQSNSAKRRGRLLVVVGTYSIGKERICVGIAKALNSKIYAPPNKQKICHALEDPELNALLTKDPREAQVHMTPLFEIRAETLDDYLRDYRDHFSRAVGFRPSGWNYRPPNSRFTESPSIQTVLYSQNWKSQFSMRDLNPQRGSTGRASCFGVPYSEHSSFRELTMFCCALRIDKIIPTVNVGSAKSREKMKAWTEKWAIERKKNGLFRLKEDGGGW